jgi:hypothetical protein
MKLIINLLERVLCFFEYHQIKAEERKNQKRKFFFDWKQKRLLEKQEKQNVIERITLPDVAKLKEAYAEVNFNRATRKDWVDPLIAPRNRQIMNWKDLIYVNGKANMDFKSMKFDALPWEEDAPDFIFSITDIELSKPKVEVEEFIADDCWKEGSDEPEFLELGIYRLSGGIDTIDMEHPEKHIHIIEEDVVEKSTPPEMQERYENFWEGFQEEPWYQKYKEESAVEDEIESEKTLKKNRKMLDLVISEIKGQKQ